MTTNPNNGLVVDPRLAQTVAEHPYPLIFMTISGAHLYGFPSPDSDYDLRGVHLLPTPMMLGLTIHDETISHTSIVNGLEIDHVTHDVRKFAHMLLKRNGYVMEQVFSPLIVFTSPDHAELKTIAQQCLTRHHSHHYFGFAETQWHLFNKETPHRVKPLLYTFRVLLTGIYLMRTGRIIANLPELNEAFQLPYIPDLIAHKQAAHEQATLADADLHFYQGEFDRLNNELQAAQELSTLPETVSPDGYAQLNDWIIQIRTIQRDQLKTDAEK